MTFVSSSPKDFGPVLKALYTPGEDHRHNLSDVNGLDTIKSQAPNVACLVQKQFLLKMGDTYHLQNVLTHNQKHGPLDPLVPFQDEPALGISTAFLVGHKLLLTAHHCVFNKDLSKFRYIFDFHIQGANQLAPIKKAWVCKITKIVKSSKDVNEGDWALVELKKHPAGLNPLRIDFTNTVEKPIFKSFSLYMLGHPCGLPLKYVAGEVEHSWISEYFFQAKIDAFKGNSGSPVFNPTTNEIVGILVAGNPDFDWYLQGHQLHVVTQAELDKRGYEYCQRTSTLAKHIIKLIDDGFYKTKSKKALGMGDDHYFGKGVKQSYQLAMKHYHEANILDPTNANAFYSIGFCYYYGHGVHRNAVTAIYYLKEAIKLNPEHVDALYLLGECYFWGRPGINQNLTLAFQHYKKTLDADPHHVKAQYKVGECYYYGKGVNIDYEQAVYYFQQAANSGDPYAIYNLGTCYYHGLGTDRDAKRAFELFREAAKHGHCRPFAIGIAQTFEPLISVGLDIGTIISRLIWV